MATNRKTLYAPPCLTRLSKTTLADLAWELVAASPGIDPKDTNGKMGELFRAAGRVRAPHADMRLLSRAKEGGV